MSLSRRQFVAAAGSSALLAGAALESTPTGWLLIAVRDEGEGIEPEHLPRGRRVLPPVVDPVAAGHDEGWPAAAPRGLRELGQAGEGEAER